MSLPAALLALSAMHEGTASPEDLDETIRVEPGGTLSIDLDRGRVTVGSHEVNEVRVIARARGFGADLVSFELEKRGNDVHLEGSFNQSMGFALWGPRVEVEAWVPRVYSVVIQTRGGSVHIDGINGRIIAETSGGAIELEHCRGPASVETSGGSIRAHDVDGFVLARTSGGPIEMKEISGAIEAVTSGGAINLQEIGGRIEARTSGGAIDASFSQAPSGILETSGGRIQVRFAAEAKLDIDAETSGGRVEVEHEVTPTGARSKHRIAGGINGGGAPLRLRTSGGNIRVRAR